MPGSGPILGVDSMPRLADPALPERRRGQILDAARECFRARGFRESTIEEICAEARISPGALYRYFGSKADIVAAIALDARGAADTALAQLETEDSLIDGLAEAARSFLEAFGAEADAALFADIWAEAARDPILANALKQHDKTAIGRLTAAIERAQAAGHAYPALPPEAAAEALLAALEGFALRRALWPHEDVSGAMRRYRALALHVLKPKR